MVPGVLSRSAYDSLFAERVRRLVDSRRAVVLGESAFGADRLALAGALGLTSQVSGPRRVTVLEGSLGVDGVGAQQRWEALLAELAPSFRAELRVVSQAQVGRGASALGAAGVLLPVCSSLTQSRTSAAWRGFAPVLRSAELVVGLCEYPEFPRCLPSVELVVPMDRVVVMHPRHSVGEGAL